MRGRGKKEGGRYLGSMEGRETWGWERQEENV